MGTEFSSWCFHRVKCSIYGFAPLTHSKGDTVHGKNKYWHQSLYCPLLPRGRREKNERMEESFPEMVSQETSLGVSTGIANRG